MPRADAAQQTVLQDLQTQVLHIMLTMGLIDAEKESMLRGGRWGVLRASATQRHGATRWIREANGALSVDVVDLQAALWMMDWASYA